MPFKYGNKRTLKFRAKLLRWYSSILHQSIVYIKPTSLYLKISFLTNHNLRYLVRGALLVRWTVFSLESWHFSLLINPRLWFSRLPSSKFQFGKRKSFKTIYPWDVFPSILIFSVILFLWQHISLKFRYTPGQKYWML